MDETGFERRLREGRVSVQEFLRDPATVLDAVFRVGGQILLEQVGEVVAVISPYAEDQAETGVVDPASVSPDTAIKSVGTSPRSAFDSGHCA